MFWGLGKHHIYETLIQANHFLSCQKHDYNRKQASQQTNEKIVVKIQNKTKQTNKDINY